MDVLKRDRLLQTIAVVTFIWMIVINGLANALPIGGITSGEVSDSYPNLFAPIGFTFGIWGLIYSGLLLYTVYQVTGFRKTGFTYFPEIRGLNLYYGLSSVINGFWLLAWHYRRIGLTLVLMVLLLGLLIRINLILKTRKPKGKDYWLLRLPFSIYFGWITVATVANVTTFLVSVGWQRFGLNEGVVTVVVIIMTGLIGLAYLSFFGDIAYGAVLVWAYIGILSKHLSPIYFNRQYESVVVTVSGLIVVTLIAMRWTMFRKVQEGLK